MSAPSPFVATMQPDAGRPARDEPVGDAGDHAGGDGGRGKAGIARFGVGGRVQPGPGEDVEGAGGAAERVEQPVPARQIFSHDHEDAHRQECQISKKSVKKPSETQKLGREATP